MKLEIGTNSEARDVVPGADQRGSRGYRFYVLALLCGLFFLSYADRQLLGVLISPIKEEFELSDTVLGLMSGLAFGLFYGLCSLPLARLGDRSSRKRLISVCLALWSGATMASGAATSAMHLLIARAAVGVGEAGGTPSSISMISDLFSPRHRGTAIAMYNAAGSFGGAAVMILGAWIATHYGWRYAFYAVGLPGLFLAIIIAFTVKEPIRGASDGGSAKKLNPVSLMETLRHVFGQRALLYTMIGGGLSSAVISCTAWLPAFLQRTHDLSLVEAGGSVGLALLLAGPFGGLIGGQLTDRLSGNGTSAILMAVCVLTLATVAGSLFLVLAPTFFAVVIALIVWKLVATTFPAPTWSLSQSLVDVHMRATSQALMGIFSNVLGYGCGPFIVGILSEVFRPHFGDESLRWALGTTMVGIGFLAACMYGLAARAARKSFRSEVHLN